MLFKQWFIAVMNGENHTSLEWILVRWILIRRGWYGMSWKRWSLLGSFRL
jgi:hypothetical protein